MDLRNSARGKPLTKLALPESKIGKMKRERQLVEACRIAGVGANNFTFSEASEDRDITIGGNFEYFLFRQNKEKAKIGPSLGALVFL